MAKAKINNEADGVQASQRAFILALAVLTLLGGGAGILFGMQMGEMPSLAATADQSTSEASTGAESKDEAQVAKLGPAASVDHGGGEAGTSLVSLGPIFANLAEPKNVWVRLEAALMIKPGPMQRDVLVAQVSQDIMQFLRTVKLAQLEDASGLQFMHDDLNDIVRSRSDGQVIELLIKGLIVE